MGLKSIFSIGLVIVLNCGGNASAASLDQLAAIQTLLRVEIDGTRLCEKTLGQWTPSQLAGLPQLLEGEVRSKLAGLTGDERRLFFRNSERISKCEARCRCGIYADWIGEDLEFSELRSQLMNLEKKSALKTSDFVKCARANQNWICRNSVFRKLVGSVEKIEDGESK